MAIPTVRMIRHGKKGNGTDDTMDGGPKDMISHRGFQEIRAAGANLNVKFERSGGSVHKRSVETVRELLVAAKQYDAIFLPPDPRLGDEAVIWDDFRVDRPTLVALMKDMSCADGLRRLVTENQFAQLVNGMLEAARDALASGRNTLLGTHDPWLPMMIEFLTGAKVNVPELGFVDIMERDGRLVIVDTNIPGIPTNL
jgi:hypothetical protein